MGNAAALKGERGGAEREVEWGAKKMGGGISVPSVTRTKRRRRMRLSPKVTPPPTSSELPASFPPPPGGGGIRQIRQRLPSLRIPNWDGPPPWREGGRGNGKVSPGSQRTGTLPPLQPPTAHTQREGRRLPPPPPALFISPTAGTARAPPPPRSPPEPRDRRRHRLWAGAAEPRLLRARAPEPERGRAGQRGERAPREAQ